MINIPIKVPESSGVLKERNSKEGRDRDKKIKNLGKTIRKKWSRRTKKENTRTGLADKQQLVLRATGQKQSWTLQDKEEE